MKHSAWWMMSMTGCALAMGGQTPPGGGAASGKQPAAPAATQHGGASVSVAAPFQEPADIVWGPGREVQAGLRVRLWATDQHAGRFIFDVYVRNRTKRTLNVNCLSFTGLSVPSDSDYTTEVQSDTIYCTPHLRDGSGRPIDINFRQGVDNSQYVLAPGQVVNVSHWMLRTMNRDEKMNHNPKGTNKAGYTQVAFVEPGKHRMTCDVSVSVSPGSSSRRATLRTGEAVFDVTEADVAAK